MQSSESGRKLNQAVNTTSRAVGMYDTNFLNFSKMLILKLFNSKVVLFHMLKMHFQIGGHLLLLRHPSQLIF